jgi:hypothetical protein
MKRNRLIGTLFLGIVAGLAVAFLSRKEPRANQSVATLPAKVTPQIQPPLPTQLTNAPTTPVNQTGIQPTDVRYDAFELHRQSHGDLTAKDIFDNEPRDAKYAPVFERRNLDALAKMEKQLSLEKKIVAVSSECKTLSCVSRVKVAIKDQSSVYGVINSVLLGDVQSPLMEPDDDPAFANITFHNLYRPSMREDSTYLEFVKGGFDVSIQGTLERLAEEQQDASNKR